MISIVVPFYNEEENVLPLYEEISESIDRLNKDFEIIFVDDGSTDSTYDIMADLAKKEERLKIIKFRRNFGQSAALKAGFDNAGGEFIITLDADLQNDPHDIPAMIDKIDTEDYDVVCGWRFNRKDAGSKKLFSKFANFLRNKLTSEQIHDSGSTFRIYKKECTRDLELYGELHRYIPAMLSWKGYRIGEIKTNHRERLHGKTKYNCKRLIKGFLDLIVITFWQKYSLRPIHIFGGIGMTLGMLGGIVTVYLIFMRLFFGTGLANRPLFTASILAIIIGIQFFTIGILADVMIKIYYGQNGRKNYLIEGTFG
ncbi:glycosyltransferase family 2 protein [Methanolobus halotolerans]|uniref:Glycosyltransferase n=1 Tax=Methanolobus halotolerans TaxID=2052935 RepID=A0A4E0R0T2_9EURY|nr:glycosyltransferase family 2 protein [Methanolobus halotolerans]TGC10616.1 glycosyltransferase [Methanolobus halotolerans]